MPEARLDLLPVALPLWGLGALWLTSLVLWGWLRRRRRRADPRLPTLMLRVPQYALAVTHGWLFLQGLARALVLQTPWPLWVGALLLGLGTESVLAAWQRERAALTPRLGGAILTCRLVALWLVTLILMRPVLITHFARHITRRVAVLVDGSDSMRFVDHQWQAEETRQWRDLGLNCNTTRLALAHALLVGHTNHTAALPLAPYLAAHYDLELFTFARDLQRATAAELTTRHTTGWWRGATDLAAALEGVLTTIPSDELAGVLILSDGQHNQEATPMPIARRFAALGAPICSIPLGGTRLPRDLSIANVQAPSSIFLGDQARFDTTVRATGAQGELLELSLLAGTNVLERQVREITAAEWQHEFRLTAHPATKGVHAYTVAVKALANELFAANNSWPLDLAVSDERINVLLVDYAPRWEFRYLRNLFHGRDKSVHLQFWLVRPDGIRGNMPFHWPPASAARPFGESEAGGWPLDRAAWRAFDVIILGDVAPEDLPPEVQQELCACVTERGALLVVIGGPQAMPHRYPAPAPLASLLPFTLAATSAAHTPAAWWQAPQGSFKLELTPSGARHMVMQQSDSFSANEEFWAELPAFTWRLPVVAKPEAEVLAIADDVRSPGAAGTDAQTAVDHLEAVLRHRARQAVIATMQAGRGKVLGLACDQTWRLRYRVGDRHHHRFWGQVLRWGLGERLRDGTEYLRVGTDRVVYPLEHPIAVTARLLDQNFTAIADGQLTARLYAADTHEVAQVTLAARPDSHGIYQATLPAPTQPGAYHLKVYDLQTPGHTGVVTRLAVSAEAGSPELGATQPALEHLQLLAQGSAGMVASVADLKPLAEAFGARRRTVIEQQEHQLWSNPAWLAVLGLLLSVEWILRKKGGVA